MSLYTEHKYGNLTLAYTNVHRNTEKVSLALAIIAPVYPSVLKNTDNREGGPI